jgi:hypothetical protein
VLYLPDKSLSYGTATLAVAVPTFVSVSRRAAGPAGPWPHLGTQVDPAQASEKIPFGVSECRGREEGGVRLLEAVAKISTNQKTVQSDAAESYISHAVDCVLCR